MEGDGRQPDKYFVMCVRVIEKERKSVSVYVCVIQRSPLVEKEEEKKKKRKIGPCCCTYECVVQLLQARKAAGIEICALLQF